MPSTPRARRSTSWVDLPREQLLDVRIADLGVTLEDSTLAPRVEALHAEFERRGLDFRPYAWLSTDWFAPDDTSGFAIPFYLAHPRLIRLERSQMLEVEGGTTEECMKLMRHEAAHALDNAYGLRRRKDWRETFGPAGVPYRSSYTPDPTSREYVLHLDYWYSQSHPLEDFAETFAVWLRPGSRWRTRYEGWPALQKLDYVDRLMKEISGTPPRLTTRRKEEPAGRVRMTLRSYYEQKKRIYQDEGTPAFDGQLSRMFPDAQTAPEGAPKLTSFLRQHREKLVRRVASGTGQHRYLVDHVVREMITRAKLRDLRVPEIAMRGKRRHADTEGALIDTAILLTSLTSQFLYGGHNRYQR
ncbi:hypothetical protein Poly30_36690 [Planctomycetes bacterium Poly30]|uniref:Zinc-binding metallo-peptidase n=1 Tax=Saltatorellus ferox TaxID=2528018 RepID=A0A518EVL2_9BACT|nr:hypothetical protein Poly30_36690 [Planctomycetes bacterium Poly30]